MSLPRVPMARVPLLAFANNHVAPTNHTYSAHPSGFSSMPSNARKETKDSISGWVNSVNDVADRLEHSAEKLMNAKTTKNYLREVKQFENIQDEWVKEVGLVMNSTISNNSNSVKDSGVGVGVVDKGNNRTSHHHRQQQQATGTSSGMTTFEQMLVDRVQADVIHPDAKKNNRPQHHHHHQEMVSSLLEELKGDKQSNLSTHASDAIRMIESRQHILKQDSAPIHDVRNEDPSEKHMGSHK
ncbi:hypothetical protein BGZ65_009168 [Modicella reniformis]|uniref:Uncharacterized protein n=1 Tax=Modicella reniformis TaxID=1440133 RepID=A0A9P6IJ67_9FUNG|nr:hypothetical protein BGZ65_009168 [Modicella reniformis]